ncbi:UPF0481 protein At3g47200-like [Rhodamnia argentea]|uniref:UPF0481 protein At3g47200-like n=1 Tax=Rhodamnia argentea TaxID=178133 RepID=A0ABM3HH40_9MYRT|nr:UPF0481 protein At3g47200-like [Rhodamnia argentea]XP_048135898.1 UPF0481 protein At3g47200-like [Rhodamnia argentea]
MSSDSKPRVNQSWPHHAIDIGNLLSNLERKTQKMPKQLSRSAGRNSCCIFRVPRSLAEINEKAYQPHILSIGPYHHGKNEFIMIEEHKGQFLRDLLTRIKERGIGFEDLVRDIAPMEDKIRKSYSETLDIGSQDLIEMMILDGCFIIELFCKVGKLVSLQRDDPLLSIPWMLPFLTRDLLALENQIPFFILKSIFALAVGSSDNDNYSLAELALKFFNRMDNRPTDVLKKYYHVEGKHLLDLFRLSYIPEVRETSRKPSGYLRLVQPAKKLNVAGVKFKPRNSSSFLDIKFRNINGTLEIPVLKLDDFLSSLLLNFVAFEQCYHHCTKHITTYATFMGRLMNTPADAGFLGDRKIVENYLGGDEEVARFFSIIGKDVAFDIERSYMSKVFEDVNRYYQNGWHVRLAGFKHTYFNTPWSFMSALAALVLLILTMVQSFFAVYAYFYPRGNHN